MKVNLLLLLFSATYAVKTPPNEDYYLAAVVEYSPDRGNDTLMANAEEYVSIIKEAAPKADIIVFPEVGLLLYDQYKTFIDIPYGPDTIAPADDEKAHPALKIISQEARNQVIYVVINIHEKYSVNKENFHYNTNIIFNRTGHVIARYRKFNLFDEPLLNVTSTPEEVVFESDFGVRFGTFTCFDILFEKPALQLLRNHNVTDILYPTFWYSGLPFFTAVQTQAGWAYATNTNLLASGGNRPSGANTGSGVYAGRNGPVVYLQSQRDGTTILYSKVIKKGKSGKSSGTRSRTKKEGPLDQLLVWGDPIISKVTSIPITPQKLNLSTSLKVQHPSNSLDSLFLVEQVFENTSCHGDFCCDFFVNVTFTFKSLNTSMNSLNPYQYRMAVFDGVAKYHVRDAGVQLCSIISCLNSSLESCGKALENNTLPMVIKTESFGDLFLYSTDFHNVIIKTEQLDSSGFAIPSLLELSTDPDSYGSLMTISQFTFSTNDSIGELQFSSERLITGALYGRVFSRDASSSSYIVPTILILMFSVMFLFYTKSFYHF